MPTDFKKSEKNMEYIQSKLTLLLNPLNRSGIKKIMHLTRKPIKASL